MSSTRRELGPIPAGFIRTVQGDVRADAFGIVSYHEHLLVNYDSLQLSGTPPKVQRTVESLKRFKSCGGDAVVEVTTDCIHFDRENDPASLQRISECSGVKIVMGCGYYKKATWDCARIAGRSETQIAQDMIQAIITPPMGVGAGVIGEIGISMSEQTSPLLTGRYLDDEEAKVLRACRIAQGATGVAVILHMEEHVNIDSRLHVLEVLSGKADGVHEVMNLNRAAISHIWGGFITANECLQLLKTGVYLGFDSQWFDDHDPMPTAKLIHELVQEFPDQLLIGNDVICEAHLSTGGYAAFLKPAILNSLKQAGLSEVQIGKIQIENPRRFLACQPRKP